MQDLARFAFTYQCSAGAKPWKAGRTVHDPYQMKYRQQIRWIILLIVLPMSFLFWLVAFRFVSLPPLIVAWVLFLRSGRNRIRPVLTAWMVWLILIFSPIDVLPFPKGGSPRLVPLVMGLPTRKTAERAKRGEVILGGCIVSGFEPKYYLVW